MAQVVISEEYLSDIAQALRVKLGTSESFKPSQMANGIRRLPTAPRVISKNITANGTYSASTDGADGYSPIAVNVANSYAQSDEGKVVNSGALVSQSSQTITQNGTYNTTLNNQIVANVSNTYAAGDEGKVVDNGALVAQTSKNIGTNGTHDTTKNNSVVVSVPNTYAASDEGKVVDNGALVAQTSQNITQNGTYDTTLKNEVVVSVSGGGSGNIVIRGQSAPTSDIGNNGDVYIQEGTVPLDSNVNYVEYLQSNGTQCINTGIYATNEYGVYAEMESTSEWGAGARNTNYGSNALNIGGDNDVVNGYHLDYSSVRYTTSVPRGEKVTLSYIPNDGVLSILSNSANYTQNVAKAGSYTLASPIVLFGIGKDNAVTKSNNAKIYRYALFNGNNLIHDYLPCLDTNNVPCMWDNVVKEYIYNTGSGTFLYGNSANPQPIKMAEKYYVKEQNEWVLELQVKSRLTSKTITQNGTYNASSDNADGYSSVTVNVSGGGGGVVLF